MGEILNVGDEVYVYKDFWKSLEDETIIKGVIIHAENYDYGYHGSGDWYWDYIVKDEDGKEYYANHGSGYKPFKIATKEEIIEYIKDAISNKEELKRKAYQELSDEAIGIYIKEYIKMKKQNCYYLSKEIKKLNRLLGEFDKNEMIDHLLTSESRGKELRKNLSSNKQSKSFRN